MEKCNCTEEEAKSIINNKKGIGAEQALVKMIGKWSFKIRRVPRSGMNPKAVKYKRKTKPKRCDCILKIDSQAFQIESKLRSNPHSVYDKIITNHAKNEETSYILNYKGEIYYAMHQDTLRKLLVNYDIPRFTAWHNDKVKFYHDLFVMTLEKEKYLDILSLKQSQYPFIFLVRPKTTVS